jgi:superfamily II DNA/RNA helicase
MDNVRALSSFLSTQQFSDLGLHPLVLEAVQKYLTKPDVKAAATIPEPSDDTTIQPTEIQALSIPTLLSDRHRHVLCAAETGSGKTLAYLLPVIQQLMIDEQKHGIKRRLDHPRAVVLVPTRELVSQVVKTSKSLSHTVKFRCVGVERIQRAKLVPQLANGPIDLMVTTPTAMQMLLKQHMVSLADTRYLVMDEADSLFDAGWGEDCRKLIDTMQKIHQDRARKEKMIIVSATLPRSVHTTLDKLFPHLAKITNVSKATDSWPSSTCSRRTSRTKRPWCFAIRKRRWNWSMTGWPPRTCPLCPCTRMPPSIVTKHWPDLATRTAATM